MTRAWWKEAVVYQIYPRSFLDTTGDGFGDLNGITQKLDYLKDLGIDVIWLSPIFASPDDDNGYDISDYRDIMEKMGTMEDFDTLLNSAHEKGLKIVLDLVVNHTSDEHNWFVESRKSKDNPYRDYYFWSDEKRSNWLSFFGGDAWEHDEATNSYYLHLFSKKQPDLNWENPKVRQEVYDLMHFWLKKGIDGFRMDVIPMISKYLDFPDIDTNNFVGAINDVYTNGPRIHEFLREMNEEVLSKYDALSMGEGIGINADQGLMYTDEDRKELQMIYHFDHMSLDWGKGGKFDPKPFKLTEFKYLFRTWHEKLGDKGWLTVFLDNHDFPRMVSRFGNDQQYRVESAKLLCTLLLTLRGTPCLYQGSEIGMTNVNFPSLDQYEDIEIRNKIAEHKALGKDLKELEKVIHQIARDNARTPMQWNDQPNGGFSTSEKTWIDSNPNFDTINVENALKDKSSIWYYYQNMLKFRKSHKTFVYGEYKEYMEDTESVYVYKRWDGDGEYMVMLNFTDITQEVVDIQEIRSLKVLVNNYKTPPINSLYLRPWEAVVYTIG
ncbi:MAG: alpha-glucosidase [bacterium]|nr:alpha-glucosidase [bacterium]